jgi:hypothetical protein
VCSRTGTGAIDLYADTADVRGLLGVALAKGGIRRRLKRSHRARAEDVWRSAVRARSAGMTVGPQLMMTLVIACWRFRCLSAAFRSRRLANVVWRQEETGVEKPSSTAWARR